MKKINKESGQVSRTVIILAVTIILAVVVIYGVIRYAAVRNVPAPTLTDAQKAAQQAPPPPVYDVTLGDIRMFVISAVDLGQVIKAKTTYQHDLTTTEKFIKVTIGAQNKGKIDTRGFSWGMGNIVDSVGRNFTEDQNSHYFLPLPNLCGAILKPEFAPTPCVQIFEVSRASTSLKVEVNAIVGNSSKPKEAFLDLPVK